MRCITHLVDCQNRKLPTDSADEAYLFGGAYIGLDLPNFSLKGKTGAEILATPWTIPGPDSGVDADPRLENGHCVAAIGYDEAAIYVVTWGRLKSMSWEFLTRYTDEVYAVLSTDWVEESRKSPSGFDLTALEVDLSRVTRQPAMPIQIAASGA